LATLSPRKKLRVVETITPIIELSRKLTGDYNHDRKIIMDFCGNHDQSEQTVRGKLALCGYGSPLSKTVQARTNKRPA
jgi:hypothetical protein